MSDIRPKVVGYIRVSTEQQAQVGTGLRRQQDAIEKFCRDNNFSLERIFSEEGISGTTLRSRVALWDLFRYCEEHRPDAVVVERTDRLARDVIICEQILQFFKELGVALYATDTGTVDWAMAESTDPTRKLIRQVLAAVAEWERAMVVYRLQAGRFRSRSLNNSWALGCFTYRQYLAVLIRILRRAGLAKRDIVKIFNEIKLLTPSGTQWTLASYQQFYTKIPIMVGPKLDMAVQILEEQFNKPVSPEEIMDAVNFFSEVLKKPLWEPRESRERVIEEVTQWLEQEKLAHETTS